MVPTSIFVTGKDVNKWMYTNLNAQMPYICFKHLNSEHKTLYALINMEKQNAKNNQDVSEGWN